jgi:catechol 2,3-dioxygenase-like lactoylglutathione lyase family enzyme
MKLAIRNVVIDCNNAELMTTFWGALLGFEVKWSNPTYRFLLDPDGRRPGLVLQLVPERPREKNRLHLDLEVADVAAAVDQAVELGATRVETIEEDGIAWTVMRDPEGNHFCLQQA